MKRLSISLVALSTAIATLMTACGGSGEDAQPGGSNSTPGVVQQGETSTPRDVELAPEFVSIDAWHNTEPMSLAGLRGETVLIVFFSDT